jgi:Zn-finger nucleic acid-binding protein
VTLQHAPVCPACKAPLVRASSRWEVLACLSCGGVWTDPSASRRITSTVDRELVGIAADVAKRAVESAPDVPTPDSRRMCPSCGAPLACVRSGRVAVDVCSAHGTWFDRDELGRLARNLEFERLSLDPPVGDEPATSRTAAMLLEILGRADDP